MILPFSHQINNIGQNRLRIGGKFGLDVYWIVHNFVRVHFTTRQVPAVALGILDHGFALHEVFLMQKVA